MQLNEVTKKLPKHLLQFVVDQPYNEYTPVDQAVWRYVMRQNYHHLRQVAHESYVQGLALTGVEIEQIPTLYGMNRILKDIGWAAVAVDGFIPPGAFMEFTKYNVLVIAADIRTLEHIEYTPAPDVIHESAGHAPILAVPEFAAYLKHIGELGSKAFSSQKDVELYEAIRHLSIIKEDPATPLSEIGLAESDIDRIQRTMGEPSEMALIRNLHWWTVEYGLIGTTDQYKIYGAGLLSSIGEGMSCLSPHVTKLPYTLDAMHCNYDITKPQPQLFVTPDFKHLTNVLRQFTKLMAYTTGGLNGIQKAIASQQVGTITYSSGLQLSGMFTHVKSEQGLPIYIETSGPSALALHDIQLKNFGKDKFPNGFCSPVGKLNGIDQPVEDMSDVDLKFHHIEEGTPVTLHFQSGIVVKGMLKEVVRSDSGKNILFAVDHAVIMYRNDELRSITTCFIAIGEKITSAFAGPADIDAFEPLAIVPKEKMHKITYTTKTRELHQLYQAVRDARTNASQLETLPGIWTAVTEHFPNDWLLSMEILELLGKHTAHHSLTQEIRLYLENKKITQPELDKLITQGLALIDEKKHQGQLI